MTGRRPQRTQGHRGPTGPKPSLAACILPSLQASNSLLSKIFLFNSLSHHKLPLYLLARFVLFFFFTHLKDFIITLLLWFLSLFQLKIFPLSWRVDQYVKFSQNNL